MMREVMQAANLTIWPVISLVIFSIVAVLVLMWIYRKGSAEIYEAMSYQALEGQELKDSKLEYK